MAAGQFRKHSIQDNVSEMNCSKLYLNLIPALNSPCVELPDDWRMIDEWRRLERRRGRSGKDTIETIRLTAARMTSRTAWPEWSI
jgi:hypothetical protein